MKHSMLTSPHVVKLREVVVKNAVVGVVMEFCAVSWPPVLISWLNPSARKLFVHDLPPSQSPAHLRRGRCLLDCAGCQGGSLEDFVRKSKNGRLTETRTRALFQQVCSTRLAPLLLLLLLLAFLLLIAGPGSLSPPTSSRSRCLNQNPPPLSS